MYAVPLIVGQVIATKSVKYMPLLPLVAALLNGATWTTYGFLGDIDVFIVVPNLLGAGLALVQLVLYGIYSRIEKMPIANDTKPRIGDPSEGAAGIV